TELERLLAKIVRLLVDGTPEEIRASRISVETLRRMAKEAQLGFEAELRCAAARQLLDHRLGQMCARFLRRGRPKKVADGDHLRLTDIVKNKTQSSRCRKSRKSRSAKPAGTTSTASSTTSRSPTQGCMNG